MKTKNKNKGEMDYDYENDILYFKVSNKDYYKSLELDNIVVDFDQNNLITGLQIFNASDFLNIDKEQLVKIPNWSVNITTNDGKLEINLVIKIVDNNKILEKNPIIVKYLETNIPNSNVMCNA